MKHTIEIEIPDGEYCCSAETQMEGGDCKCLVGELHSMCFITEGDLEEEGDGRVLKSDECPSKK